MVRLITYLALLAASLIAIEGQDPTPRFIPPDFSVEEERITTPGDLIDFFGGPFEEFLRMTPDRITANPIIMFSSEQEASGRGELHYLNIFADMDGGQYYFGEDIPRQMLRNVEFRAGYADFILGKFPYGAMVEADYGYFRGAYEPSQYSIRATGKGHIPLLNFLFSPFIFGERDSWYQRPGPLDREQPYDLHRQQITNAFGGGMIIRGTLSEYTGFKASGSGQRADRYCEGQWNREYQILSGMGAMVFDSDPLRIEVGGGGHKTWEETIIAPHLDFHLVGSRFYVKAYLGSESRLPVRSEFDLSPRVDFPVNAGYIITPTLVDVLGRLELKPDQYLMGHLDYRTTRGRPVLLSPLNEAPQIECLEISHQSFTVRLLNDFGTFSNSLNLTISSDEYQSSQLPTEPIQVIADTFSVDLGAGFSLTASGKRQNLSQIAPKIINDVSVGGKYTYGTLEFHLGISNLLRNDIWDEKALSFSREIRFWGGVAVDI